MLQALPQSTAYQCSRSAIAAVGASAGSRGDTTRALSLKSHSHLPRALHGHRRPSPQRSPGACRAPTQPRNSLSLTEPASCQIRGPQVAETLTSHLQAGAGSAEPLSPSPLLARSPVGQQTSSMLRHLDLLGRLCLKPPQRLYHSLTRLRMRT